MTKQNTAQGRINLQNLRTNIFTSFSHINQNSHYSANTAQSPCLFYSLPLQWPLSHPPSQLRQNPQCRIATISNQEAPKDYLADFRKQMSEFSASYGVVWYNDLEFVCEDNCYADLNHLNRTGAEIYTMSLFGRITKEQRGGYVI